MHILIYGYNTFPLSLTNCYYNENLPGLFTNVQIFISLKSMSLSCWKTIDDSSVLLKLSWLMEHIESRKRPQRSCIPNSGEAIFNSVISYVRADYQGKEGTSWSKESVTPPLTDFLGLILFGFELYLRIFISVWSNVFASKNVKDSLWHSRLASIAFQLIPCPFTILHSNCAHTSRALPHLCALFLLSSASDELFFSICIYFFWNTFTPHHLRLISNATSSMKPSLIPPAACIGSPPPPQVLIPLGLRWKIPCVGLTADR